MTTTNNRNVYTSGNNTQVLGFNFDDHGVCDWHQQLGTFKYYPEDIHRHIHLDLIQISELVGDTRPPVELPENITSLDLMVDFELAVKLGLHGTVLFTNHGGKLTVKGGLGFPRWVETKVTTTLYLGEAVDFDWDGHEETLNTIIDVRNFLKDMDVPVHCRKNEAGQGNIPSPWLGLFNEAVHAVLALRNSQGADHVTCEGDAPWPVVEFFKSAQTEERRWFWNEQEAVGHVSMWFAYDDARRFCMQAMGNAQLTSEWRAVFGALYQVFACAMNITLSDAHEPFFKHVRGVYRKHTGLVKKTPSLEILPAAYYDTDYLNIYGGVKRGTIQYMEQMERQARYLLDQKRDSRA